MNFLDIRQDSFKASSTKKPWKYRTKYLAGNFLAQLGFYHTPSKEVPELVTCFSCNETCDWKSWGNPVQYHLKNNPCDFIRMWGGVKGEKRWAEFTSHTETDKDMIDLIKGTYHQESKWPYGLNCAQKRPTVDDLALAGFCFQPMSNSPDHTVCPYCETSLDGWEAEDDAVQEHKKRNPNCIFFKNTEVIRLEEESVFLVEKKARSKKKTKLAEAKVFEIDSDEEIVLNRERKEAIESSTRTVRKRQAPAKVTKKVVKKRKEPVNETRISEDFVKFPMSEIIIDSGTIKNLEQNENAPKLDTDNDESSADYSAIEKQTMEMVVDKEPKRKTRAAAKGKSKEFSKFERPKRGRPKKVIRMDDDMEAKTIFQEEVSKEKMIDNIVKDSADRVKSKRSDGEKPSASPSLANQNSVIEDEESEESRGDKIYKKIEGEKSFELEEEIQTNMPGIKRSRSKQPVLKSKRQKIESPIKKAVGARKPVPEEIIEKLDEFDKSESEESIHGETSFNSHQTLQESPEPDEQCSLFEILEKKSKLGPEEIQELYENNKGLLLRDYLDLLTFSAAKRLEDVLQEEIMKLSTD